MDYPSRLNPKHFRAGLLLQGKGRTLAAWTKAHGFSISTVKAALKGQRNGPKSKAVLRAALKVSQAAQLKNTEAA